MRRSFLLVLAVAFSAVAFGCSTRECELDSQCGEGQICSASGSCRRFPVEPPAHEDRSDGWEDLPGSGRAFILDTLAIADAGQGFDLDGQCRGEGDCIDNALWLIGQLGNDQIRQGLLGGETLMIIEVAGVDPPFDGDDANVTLKLYRGHDADRPLLPANNFQIPQGETKCCEFLIDPSSLDHRGLQARNRIRAKIEDGRLRSLEPGFAALPFILTATSAADMRDLELRRATVAVSVGPGLGRLSDGLLGGVIPLSALFASSNPYCKTLNQLCPEPRPASSLLELMLGFSSPDADLDGDGLERADVSRGQLVRCYDGCGDCARGPVVPALDPAYPATCALSPRMADGYSVALQFSAVPATIVGVGENDGTEAN